MSATGQLHDVKCWPQFYQPVIDGEKPFEARKNDRNYKVGDTLLLREWSTNTGYTGRNSIHKITYILDSKAWVQKGSAILGIKPLGATGRNDRPDLDLILRASDEALAPITKEMIRHCIRYAQRLELEQSTVQTRTKRDMLMAKQAPQILKTLIEYGEAYNLKEHSKPLADLIDKAAGLLK